MTKAGELGLYFAKELEAAYENGEILDYLDENALFYEYTSDSDGDYLGTTFALQIGGPAVYYDTRTSLIEAYAAGEEMTVPVEREVSNEVNYDYEERWSWVKSR